MQENFITNIYVKQARNVKDLNIPLAKDRRQHLIITGKNGSGKTSLLEELNKFFVSFTDGQMINYFKKLNQLGVAKGLFKQAGVSGQVTNHSINQTKNWLDQFFGGTRLNFKYEKVESFNNKFISGKYLYVFFTARRHTQLNVPKGISKVDLKKKYDSTDRINTQFIQYIVNLKADRSFAKDDEETEMVQQIDAWFERFENSLREIFDAPELQLKFDRKNYNFEIVLAEDNSFNLNQLSDGYSAILSIVTELILRMEAHDTKAYDMEGVVLIDEIETHLHVDLQKKILPFLIAFFPKIQFIVTTHSPFVISSVANATICDLEHRTVISDLTAYSYDALLESYFDVDKYSNEVKEKVLEYERLMSEKNKSKIEKERIQFLTAYFDKVPKFLKSDELVVKLQEIELKALLNK